MLDTPTPLETNTIAKPVAAIDRLVKLANDDYEMFGLKMRAYLSQNDVEVVDVGIYLRDKIHNRDKGVVFTSSHLSMLLNGFSIWNASHMEHIAAYLKTDVEELFLLMSGTTLDAQAMKVKQKRMAHAKKQGAAPVESANNDVQRDIVSAAQRATAEAERRLEDKRKAKAEHDAAEAEARRKADAEAKVRREARRENTAAALAAAMAENAGRRKTEAKAKAEAEATPAEPAVDVGKGTATMEDVLKDPAPLPLDGMEATERSQAMPAEEPVDADLEHLTVFAQNHRRSFGPAAKALLAEQGKTVHALCARYWALKLGSRGLGNTLLDGLGTWTCIRMQVLVDFLDTTPAKLEADVQRNGPLPLSPPPTPKGQRKAKPVTDTLEPALEKQPAEVALPEAAAQTTEEPPAAVDTVEVAPETALEPLREEVMVIERMSALPIDTVKSMPDEKLDGYIDDYQLAMMTLVLEKVRRQDVAKRQTITAKAIATILGDL